MSKPELIVPLPVSPLGDPTTQLIKELTKQRGSLKDFNQVQNKLGEVLPESQSDEQLDERESFECKYYGILAQANCILDIDCASPNIQISEDSLSVHHAETCKFGPCRKCNAKHNTIIHREHSRSPIEGRRSLLSAHEQGECSSDPSQLVQRTQMQSYSSQMVGPAIQGDLFSILLRFRENTYIACADIEKMYRQVLVVENQRDLQLILWRSNPDAPIESYRLNTVTYGTTSAPFLSITKRGILSIISQIFDPLGLLSATIISVKIILQKLWLLKIDWDTELPHDVSNEFNKFLNSLNELCNIRIPRHTFARSHIRSELHIFTDASQVAYGACAYVRTFTQEGVTIRLLCAKGKVAPLKTLTVPRLELCGAITGARLAVKDFSPLTPAHFLVGRPLTSPASEDYEQAALQRLTRYQRVEQVRQHFWTRWTKEYVSELQVRTKWMKSRDSLKEGTLVLIKDDNSPPLKWSMGRIVSTFPGKDGVSRVAANRVASGAITRRAFSKICPLPLDAADNVNSWNLELPRPGACQDVERNAA
ncbi:uncharacterized protein LOC125075505 [Vanessa atalanta]|uniref:uncharacterized protein LOC125075505 n=1 Tax=Vanessa atalanta TaxID=42275 RepID=UPI001FCDA8D6|nr:uncharacterized protein LOC125075505 [Vanessa atalanta]